MNKREAIAVQALLDWVLNLSAFEHAYDVQTTVLDDDEFVRVVGVLADRSRTALDAGVDQGDAIAAAMRLLGIPGATTITQAAVDGVDLDLPANAGSAS